MLRLWRFWLIVFPFLQEWQKMEWSRSIFTITKWWQREGLKTYLRRAWHRAGRMPRVQPSVPLPVLSNRVDAPCEGCGGRCCTRPKGKAGFDIVHVYAWEEFAVRQHHMLTPHMARPGEWQMTFTSERCPMLLPDDRCGAYAYRPIACRQFNCADGLEIGDRTCATDFIDSVPEVKERLRLLGYHRYFDSRLHSK